MRLTNLPKSTIILTGRVKWQEGYDHPLVRPDSMVKGKWTEIQLDFSRLNELRGHRGKQGEYVFIGFPVEEIEIEF